jgi:hypothetical protein
MKERSRYRVDGDYLGLTAESPIWDPNSTMFNELEMRLVDRYGELEENPGTHPRQLFALITETSLHESSATTKPAGHRKICSRTNVASHYATRCSGV